MKTRKTEKKQKFFVFLIADSCFVQPSGPASVQKRSGKVINRES